MDANVPPTPTGAAFRRWLGRRWPWFAAAALAGLALGVLAGTVMTPAYQVTTVLTPAQENDRGALGGLGGSLGGLASLAGVQMGGSGDRVEALEVLRSRQLAREFIVERKLESVLLPGGRRLFGLLPPAEPSLERAVGFFLERVLTVLEDRRSGVVQLSITWKDGAAAADWANDYVRLANDTMRSRAIAEAMRRSDYLRKHLQDTQVLGVREAAFNLIETNLKNSMVAHTRLEFAYRIADPAVAPDKDDVVRPKRLLLAVFAAFAMLLFAGAVLYAVDGRARRPTKA